MHRSSSILLLLILVLGALPSGAARAVAPGEVLLADFPDAPAPSRIVRYNASGNLIGIFADAAEGITAPRDLEFNGAGHLYVADNASVIILDGDGALLGTITTGLTKAESLAFNGAGELFVSNRISSGSSEILKYSAAGALLQTWTIPEFDSGGPKPFAREIAFGPGGLLYMALRGSNTNTNDNLVATLNTTTGAFASFAASAQQVTQPIGLVFEPAGTLLVVKDTGTQTTKASSIVRLSAAGVFVAQFWSQGAVRDLVFDGFGQLHGSDRLGGAFLWNPNGTLKKTYGAASASAPLSVALIPAGAPYCQNEILEAGEQCDDGNFDPCDGCSAACITEFGCGDGSTCGAETCDDGNTTGCDGCSAICAVETCGDGITCAGLGETCDDGNTDPCDGCSPVCANETCGNGILDCNEQCDDGNPAGCDGCSSCKIDELAFQDQFESGLNGWTATGLWNQDTLRSVSPTTAWYYGNPVLRNYETFFPPENDGSITSPFIDLTTVSGASLMFNYWLETQNQAGLDLASVEASTDGFVSNIVSLETQLPEAGLFTKKTYDLSAFNGNLIQLRLGFDTVDGTQNVFEGFYVDDVTVQGMGAPVCGNGMAANACGEGCDDGNTAGGDGCSAVCQAEGVTGQVTFSGTGQGGSIEITVSGVPLSVSTFAGDSAIEVAARVADAINNDPMLQGLGVWATYSTNRLDVIGGVVDTAASTDPGIQINGGGSVPALSRAGTALFAALFTLSSFLGLRRRRSPIPPR
ncbi:MAG: hypothetical protein Q8Q14_06425 [Gemmatimonadales bacterium]|nr:hypothetical protein [Gemmatimonadales bacterium]